MKADITLTNAKVYNFIKADVKLGEKFAIDTDSTPDTVWAFTNDPVLESTGDGNHLEVLAAAEGVSTLILMNKDLTDHLLKLTITVVPTLEKASDLAPTADAP